MNSIYSVITMSFYFAYRYFFAVYFCLFFVIVVVSSCHMYT